MLTKNENMKMPFLFSSVRAWKKKLIMKYVWSRQTKNELWGKNYANLVLS